jgi:hypothetical protein
MWTALTQGGNSNSHHTQTRQVRLHVVTLLNFHSPRFTWMCVASRFGAQLQVTDPKSPSQSALNPTQVSPKISEQNCTFPQILIFCSLKRICKLSDLWIWKFNRIYLQRHFKEWCQVGFQVLRKIRLFDSEQKRCSTFVDEINFVCSSLKDSHNIAV